MIVRMIVGLVLTVVAFAVAGRRLCWLKRLARSGQPAPERLEYARTHAATDLKTQLTEVIGQRELLHLGSSWEPVGVDPEVERPRRGPRRHVPGLPRRRPGAAERRGHRRRPVPGPRGQAPRGSGAGRRHRGRSALGIC